MLGDGDYVYIRRWMMLRSSPDAGNRPMLMHINYATLEELDDLPGIGPALARNVLDYAPSMGRSPACRPGQCPGLGPSKLDALRDLLIFD